MTPRVAPEEVEDRLRILGTAVQLSEDDEAALDALKQWKIPSPKPRAALRRSRTIPVLGAVAGLLIFAVFVNVLAAYFAPRYGRALADAPGIGPIGGRFLNAVGLDPQDVTLFDSSGTSSGHTIKLVGGYADSLRTVLFLQIDGKGTTGDPKAYGQRVGDYLPDPDGISLTDQFAHVYSGGVSGGTQLSYEPLAWPASQVGARLTLTITGLWEPWLKVSGPIVPAVTGVWTLHATLVSEPASATTLPPPLIEPGITYAFTSARASGNTMSINFSVAGPVVDSLVRQSQRNGFVLGPESPTFASYFGLRMFDSSGADIRMSEWGYTFPKSVGEPIRGGIDAFIHGPGSYGVEFGAFSAATEVRWIVVKATT